MPSFKPMRLSMYSFAWQAQLAQALAQPASLPVRHAESQESAAVLLLLENKAEPELLMTRRSTGLHRHGGECSFVGGRADAGDPSLLATAKREAYEEIGLPWPASRILGRLNDQQSLHGLQVSAFVGLYDNFCPRLNPREVDALFKLPLQHLHAHYLSHWDCLDRGRQSYYLPHYQFQQFEIWGLSALFIVELLGLMGLAKINIWQKPAAAQVRVLSR